MGFLSGKQVCLTVVLAMALFACTGRPIKEVQIASTVDRPLDYRLVEFNSSDEESVMRSGHVDGIAEFHSRIFGDCTGDEENDPDILRLLDRETGAVVAERDLTEQPICVKERLVYDGETIKTIPGDIFDPWPDEYEAK